MHRAYSSNNTGTPGNSHGEIHTLPLVHDFPSPQEEYTGSTALRVGPLCGIETPRFATAVSYYPQKASSSIGSSAKVVAASMPQAHTYSMHPNADSIDFLKPSLEAKQIQQEAFPVHLDEKPKVCKHASLATHPLFVKLKSNPEQVWFDFHLIC